MSPDLQWLTTSPNPRVRATGYDAGQRGLRLHAIEATETTPLSSVRYKQALCGLRPGHGWGMDLFIDRPCRRCVRIALAGGAEVPEALLHEYQLYESMSKRLRESGRCA